MVNSARLTAVYGIIRYIYGRRVYHYHMAMKCPVCKHKDADLINIACMEGVGTMQIAQQYGLQTTSIDHHRRSGHPGKALTAMVLDAHNGPLSDFTRIQIASKVERMTKLQTIVDKVEQVIEERAKAYAHLPGGSTGLVGLKLRIIGRGIASQVVEESFFDKELAGEYRALLEQAAKEAGEWKPDGGEKADATRMLAQSIVIHASVAAQNLDQKVDTLTIEATGEMITEE